MTADLKAPRIVRLSTIPQTPTTFNGVTGWVNYGDAQTGVEMILEDGSFVWVDPPTGDEATTAMPEWDADELTAEVAAINAAGRELRAA